MPIVGNTHHIEFVPFLFETIRLDSHGSILERISGTTQVFHEALPQALVLSLVSLPGGTFQMGSIRGLGFEEETPRHLVSLEPFLFGQFPVTQAQWQAVMGRAALY